ncbi:MAG: RNA polymerase sigma factor [Candidatus Binatia bacterium]
MERLYPAPRADDDLTLIAECCAGNTQAFNELVLRHQDSVSTLATRLLADHHEAEDLTQETFLRAYEQIEQFRGEAQFSTWLYRICRNLCLNRLKKKKSDPTSDVEEGTLPEELPDPSGRFPDHVLMKKERQRLIKWALSAMARELREVLMLHHTVQLSYEEIAERLRLPVGTVRSRLHRGRKELKERLHYLREE